MRLLACLAVVGCGAPPAPLPEQPKPPVAPVAVVDAGLPPDAAPAVPDDVASAPAWVFRYDAPGRLETWTLRYHGDTALLVVETAQGTTRYLGPVTDGASLALNVSSPSAKLSLECKHDQLAVAAKAAPCNDPKAKKLGVLDCYHPDFKAPMPFGPAPGVEYLVSDACTGYRLLE